MHLIDLLGELPMYAEDVLPACFVIVLVLLLEWSIGHRLGYRLTAGHIVAEALFGIYLVILVQMTIPFGEIWRTITQEGWMVKGNIMLEPFREISNFWHYGNQREKLINLLGNVVAFLPMGFFPTLLWRRFRRPWWSWMWWIVPTVVVETLQLLTFRATSVDDVLLNALGAFIGYLLFWLFRFFGLGNGTVWERKRAGGKRKSSK